MQLKKLGAENVYIGSEFEDPIRVSTGLFALDEAIGGGIPVGSATTIVGRYGSTKSALCYKIAGNAFSQLNLPVVLIQTEDPFDNVAEWATLCGLPIDNTYIVEERILETALNSALTILRESEISCLIIDSIGGLTAKEHADKVDDAQSYSLRAGFINKFYERLASSVPKENRPIILCTNHMYDAPTRYGTTEVIAGGKKQGFISALILKLTTIETGKEEVKTENSKIEAVSWMLTKWFVDKNKFGPSKTEGTYRIYVADAEYPKGTFSEAAEAMLRGLACGEVIKSGSWYVYGGKKYHGEGNLLPALDVKDIMMKYAVARDKGLNKFEITYAEEESDGQDRLEDSM